MNTQITSPSESAHLPSMIMEQHANSDCDIHNEKCATHTTENLIFFCVEHTDTLCGRCVVSQHKSCNVVDLLEVKIDDEEVNVYRSTLQGLDEQLKSAENKINRNVETNLSCKERFMTKLEQLRTEVNVWFDRLQSRCKKQCSETFDTNEKCLTQVLTFCAGLRKDIEQRQEIIEHLLTKNHIKRLNVAMHRMRQDIEEIKGNVNLVDRKSQFNEYGFKRSSGIQAFLNENSFDIGGLDESCTGSDEDRQPSETAGIPQICLSASIPTKAQQKIDAHEGEVNAVLWSPTGTMFATGGSDRKIKLWDFSLGQCQCKGFLAGSNAGITSLEYDIDEANILGASNDYACRLWSLSDLRLRHTLTGHSGKVLSAKFLGESSKVVSGSHDRTLKIWDLHTKACSKTIFAGSSCNDLVTLHGTHIISGHFDKRVRFWDTRSDNTSNEIGLQGRITSLALSPDRMSLLACTREDTLKVIDLRQNQVMHTLCDENFKVASDWSRAVFSPDGTYVAAGSQDGTLFIWNIQKGKVEKTLKEHQHSILACSWHPAGSFILTAEKQKRVILWGDM